LAGNWMIFALMCRGCLGIGVGRVGLCRGGGVGCLRGLLFGLCFWRSCRGFVGLLGFGACGCLRRLVTFSSLAFPASLLREFSILFTIMR